MDNALVSHVVSCTQSAIGHTPLRPIISMILTCVLAIPCPLTSSPMIQVAQETSNFECSFASGFEVDANSAMAKLCAGRRGSVAKTCSAVPVSRHPSVGADRAGLVATSFLNNRSDSVHTFAGTPGSSRQPVGLNGCVREKSVEDAVPS